MDERVVLWILGTVITLFTTAIIYTLKELADIRKRIHAKNNDIAKLIVEIQINAKGVAGMVKANEKSLLRMTEASDKSINEVKNTVEEVRKTITRLSKELNQLIGFLSKGE